MPQQCLSYCFVVMVNFGQVFALFLVVFLVDLEYSLFIVNVIKCYYMAIFVEHQIGVIFMGVSEKHQFATVPLTSPMRYSHRYLCISCYDDIIFNFLKFYCSSLWENFINVINEIQQMYFLHIVFLVTLSFKALIFTIETVF